MLTKVLIAGRQVSALRLLDSFLRDLPDAETRVHAITNGHVDPLEGIDFAPDVVLLRFDAEHTAELAAWAARPTQGRPILIVVGPGGHAEAMRLAIRSGARDFLPEPVTKGDLLAALEQVRVELNERKSRGRAAVHTFVGVAGGVGSSFIAANIAHLLAAHAHRRTALVDLDLNFAPTAHHLNMMPQRGLVAALEEAATLDVHALGGFAAQNSRGLKLYCSTTQTAVLSKDVRADRLATFLELLVGANEHLVLDAPHTIDGLTATAFGMATDIYMVMQQSTLHVRNATRLIRILRDELGVPQQRLRRVLNRYSKAGGLQIADINKTLGLEICATVPSHYARALESSDSGVPLYEVDKAAAITRSLLEIVASMTGEKIERAGMLRRALPSFLRN